MLTIYDVSMECIFCVWSVVLYAIVLNGISFIFCYENRWFCIRIHIEFVAIIPYNDQKFEWY